MKLEQESLGKLIRQEIKTFPKIMNSLILKMVDFDDKRSVFDLETIPTFHFHYTILIQATQAGRSTWLLCTGWLLVSYEDENEYGNDNGNEIEDSPF